MGKKDNTLLWVGGAAVVGYLLAPEEVKERLGQAAGGFGLNLGMPSIGGLLGDVSMGSLGGDGEGFIKTIIEYIDKTIPVFPPKDGEDKVDVTEQGAGETDLITAFMNLDPFAQTAVAIAAAATGVVATTVGGYLAVKGVQTTTKFANPLADALGKLTARWVQRATPTIKPATNIATKAIVKVAPKVGTKLAVRAMPILGWGILLADAVADVFRLGGFDVTEWLGFSPLIGAGQAIFTGEQYENPLEKYIKGAGSFWTKPAYGDEPSDITDTSYIPSYIKHAEGSFSPAEAPIILEKYYKVAKPRPYGGVAPTTKTEIGSFAI